MVDSSPFIQRALRLLLQGPTPNNYGLFLTYDTANESWVIVDTTLTQVGTGPTLLEAIADALLNKLKETDTHG